MTEPSERKNETTAVAVRGTSTAAAATPTNSALAVSLPAGRPESRHPALGLAPIDMTAGHPRTAMRIGDARVRLAARALEIAIDLDPAIASRYDELGLRRLLHDAELLIDRLTRSIASGDPWWMREWAEMSVPVYRRRGVSLRDLSTLCDGIRDAVAEMLGPQERVTLDTAIDAAISVFEWNARIAGDAATRNPILKFLYRGA